MSDQSEDRVSPTVRLRKVTRRLRQWRSEAGLSLDEVAPRLGWSKSKLGRLETGDTPAGPAEVMAIATVFGIPDDERDRYVALAFQARQKGWWQSYGASTPATNFTEYIGLESEASHVREVVSELIPGLLQTDRYSTELMRAWVPRADNSVTEERAQLRRQRQERLHDDKPLHLSSIIHESGLRHNVGGGELMEEQLHHLITMSKLPNVTIQVLPFDAGAVPALGAPFILLSFADAEDPDVAYADYLTGCVYVEDADEVQSYNLNYNALEHAALDPAESVRFVEQLAREL